MRFVIASSRDVACSIVDRMVDDWHPVHLGSQAVSGVGRVFVEARETAQGRIISSDMASGSLGTSRLVHTSD